MDDDNWGQPLPWYEDMFFAVAGVIFFCLCFCAIIIFAALVSILIALAIVMVLARFGVVVV